MTHFTDRMTSEELAAEALIAERRQLETASWRSQKAVEIALECDWQESITAVEALEELLVEHKGQLLLLKAHVDKHGSQLFEDAYLDRRSAEARSVA